MPLRTIARVASMRPSRSEAWTSPQIAKINPTMYPAGIRISPAAPEGTGATHPQPHHRTSEAHTFGGTARRLAVSEGLKGAGTRSEIGRTPSGPHTLPSREDPASPGGLGAAHAGATAGSLWHVEQTVASSGNSSAQCGHTFTLNISARGRGRLIVEVRSRPSGPRPDEAAVTVTALKCPLARTGQGRKPRGGGRAARGG